MTNQISHVGYGQNMASRLSSLPASLLSPQLPLRRPRLAVAMPYAVSLRKSFSGATYYLALAGIENSQLEGAFGYVSQSPLDRLSLYSRALAWRAVRKITLRNSEGYKFVDGYRHQFWRRTLPKLSGVDLINNFQLYGAEFHRHRREHNVGAFFYIDGTLSDYFEDYHQYEVSHYDPALMQQAILEERFGYHQSDAIITMSERAAITLREGYGVDHNRIFVVPPGSNLNDADVWRFGFSRQKLGGDYPFILGFVGLFPLRKGLDRLAAAVSLLRGRGYNVQLRVIGRCPREIAAIDGVHDLGFIDKGREVERFITAIADVHIGCLLSRAELAGIAAVEFLRLGVPVLGSKVGGLTDILEDGGSLSVEPTLPAEAIADLIADLIDSPNKYHLLKREAEARRDWARWKRACDEIGKIISSYNETRSELI